MSAVNHTIDDSQWATPALELTPGWNMLRLGGANEYINKDEVDLMTPLLDQFWNKSISWTTEVDAATTLSFTGTDIWAYGISGPSDGFFTAILDSKIVGTYDMRQPTIDYKHLLFDAHGLPGGAALHHLTLVNGDKGRLAFDYAIVQSGSKSKSQTLAGPAKSSAKELQSSTRSSQYSATTRFSSSASTSALTGTSGNEQSSQTHSSQTGVVSAESAQMALQKTYTAEQLAHLTDKYHFHWNAAAYFVVIFSSLVLTILLCMATNYWYRSTQSTKTRKMREVGEGETYFIAGKRPRPTTRIIEALRKGKISSPLPSEDGMSATGTFERRYSYGTSAATASVEHEQQKWEAI